VFTGRIFTHAAIHRRNLGNTRVLFDAILHHYGFTNITDRRVREFRAIIFHSTACHKSFHNVAPVYITRRLLVASTTMRILLFETGKKIRLFSSLPERYILFGGRDFTKTTTDFRAFTHTHTHTHMREPIYENVTVVYYYYRVSEGAVDPARSLFSFFFLSFHAPRRPSRPFFPFLFEDVTRSNLSKNWARFVRSYTYNARAHEYTHTYIYTHV